MWRGSSVLRYLTTTIAVLFLTLAPVACFEANTAFASEDHKTEATEGEEHAHETGPPLSLKGQLGVWSLVTFILFMVVLKKFAWGPLNEGLKERETGIRSNITAAEDARVNAEKMLADHKSQLADTQNQVKEILAEANRDADEVRQKLLAAAQRDVEALRKRTLEDLERAKNAAVKELFDNVTDQVAVATEHVLGRALQNSDQDRLIDEALAQLPNKG